jgi:metal-responsive CopG/Arc/MetJ family transcriptional regulator
MSGKKVSVSLNQQQLELLDGTVARGVAPDRETLIRTALKEFAVRHPPAQAPAKKQANQ